jgi:hypothetical protein
MGLRRRQWVTVALHSLTLDSDNKFVQVTPRGVPFEQSIVFRPDLAWSRGATSLWSGYSSRGVSIDARPSAGTGRAS